MFVIYYYIVDIKGQTKKTRLAGFVLVYPSLIRKSLYLILVQNIPIYEYLDIMLMLLADIVNKLI